MNISRKAEPPAVEPIREVPLGELLRYEQPTKYLVSSTAYSDAYATPVLTAGKSFVLGYTDETADIYQASPDSPVIIFDDFTTAFRWVDFPFKVKSSAMKMLTSRTEASVLKFVYYAMTTINFAPREHARHWISKYSKFTIYLPSRARQQAIVDDLDQFSELEAQLHRELGARRDQFAYYRDFLMTPRERERWVQLSDIGTIERGRRFTKADLRTEGVDAIHFGELYTQYDTATDCTVSKVDRQLKDSLRFASPGDLIISGVSETLEDIGTAVAWMGPGPVAVHDDCFFLHHSLNPKYVSYWFQTKAFHQEMNRHVARGKIKRLSAAALSSLHIPLPPRTCQDLITETLEPMHTLTTDVRSGLPAEIAARRKQFECYRDRLLAFSEQ